MVPDIFDVIILGGGGAGLTAGLYTSRANLSTLLLEKLMPGGQIASTALVENYPGFPDGILGPEIAQRMEAQASRYGTRVEYEEVRSVSKKDGFFQIGTSEKQYKAKGIILALGAEYRALGLENEKEFTGKGVSYCATCDGAFFKGKEVVVVGGGDSALQEGLFLTRFATQVTIVHRRDKLRASPILQERAKKDPKVRFICDTVAEKIEGKIKLEGVVLKNLKTQAVTPFKTDGLFIFIGHEPNSAVVKGVVAMDEKGYVITDENYQTSVPGIFAAGEVRKGAVKQLVSACGEGCGAALALQDFLEKAQ